MNYLAKLINNFIYNIFKVRKKQLYNIILNDDLNRLIFEYISYKDIINVICTNKYIIKSYNWKNINNPIQINFKLDYNNKISNFINNKPKDECNQILNKYKLKYLIDKYLSDKTTTEIYDIDILDKIFLHTIPHNNDLSIDIDILIKFGAKLIKIPDNAFIDKNLTHITIPNSVKSIGNFAFASNQLETIEIPNSVRLIGKCAFYHNKLTKVIIPNSVRLIDHCAFYHNQLTEVIISDSVKSIGNYTFNYNYLTNVKIPNSVRSIGRYAFCYNYLTNVIIPDSVRSIEYGAFYHNNLLSVEIPVKFKDHINNYFDNIDKINIYILEDLKQHLSI
jgi:hypothetical protein